MRAWPLPAAAEAAKVLSPSTGTAAGGPWEPGYGEGGAAEVSGPRTVSQAGGGSYSAGLLKHLAGLSALGFLCVPCV